MRASVKTAAYGLLESLTVDEVEELIKVLAYFNRHCQAASRAACLAGGCEGTKDKDRKDQGRILEEKTAGSTEMYMSGNSSVCPCCRR